MIVLKLSPSPRDAAMVRSSFSWLSTTWLIRVLLTIGLWFFATESRADEIIFLQDGRTIRAEKTEIIGGRVRIEKPAETIELPRSEVLSIHQVASPTASPRVPPPSEVYRDMTQQMTDRVRREIQDRPGTSRAR